MNNQIENLIKSSVFVGYVQQHIKEIISNRSKRNPKPGFYFKRDWYDRMIEESCLNADYFIKNIRDIWNKKSNLSSEYRDIIKIVCTKAMHETIKYFESVEENLESTN